MEEKETLEVVETEEKVQKEALEELSKNKGEESEDNE